ncbi:uncharacterized protein LOC120012856 isoform X1 [Tripterygium wilfordii]|uniref:uncharacterized protein LOC120012856 isoform X1 n=1 Tax=Tripterygium wilfordii TaxID=458696 RepID=UPI0018F814EA|nr:uncharacterized protein LOC120012856 isoform X1 [Tripterygium wilfordii]
MEPQRLEKALDGCGNDLDAAIERLLALSLDEKSEGFAVESDASSEKEKPTSFGDLAGWTDLLVRELQSAISVDDARARVSSLLQMREESIHQQEAARIEVVIRENTILKRAVAVLYRRQKQFVEDRNGEVQHLKQLLSQYQGQLTTLEQLLLSYVSEAYHTWKFQLKRLHFVLRLSSFQHWDEVPLG